MLKSVGSLALPSALTFSDVFWGFAGVLLDEFCEPISTRRSGLSMYESLATQHFVPLLHKFGVFR